jgi:hypothetical protein
MATHPTAGVAGGGVRLTTVTTAMNAEVAVVAVIKSPELCVRFLVTPARPHVCVSGCFYFGIESRPSSS